jgi:hypothetical protein
MGPSTTVHRITDRKLSVTDIPTASPTKTGWITDWTTKLIRQ